jgi:hypothetical protein
MTAPDNFAEAAQPPSPTTSRSETSRPAGERQALALAGRQRRAARPEPRLVAVGQAQDHLVHVGGLRRGDDGGAIRRRLEAGDVVGDGAVEQRHLLRQVAHVAAELLGRPALERGAVEPHRAAR